VGREPGLDADKTRDDVLEQALNARALLHSAMDGVEGGGHRATSLVAEHDEQRRVQVQRCVLDAADDLGRDDVARYPDDEEFPQARVEDELRRHARVAATHDRRVGALRTSKVGELFLAHDREARIATDEALVSRLQIAQDLVSGFRVIRHVKPKSSLTLLLGKSTDPTLRA